MWPEGRRHRFIGKEAHRAQPSRAVMASGWQDNGRKPHFLFPDTHSEMRLGRIVRNTYLAVVDDRQLDAGKEILHDGVEQRHVDRG